MVVSAGTKKDNANVSLKKVINYQQADAVGGLIGYAAIILQYIFVGAFETGVTGIAALIKKLVNFISGPTAKVFLPEFSKLYNSGNFKELRKSYQLIMRVQMLFINLLGTILIGNTKWLLSIFSPELLQYKTLFKVVAVVFLVSATLGPTSGLLQMTGNENKDNIIRWTSAVFMITTWIILRKNRMFALIGMTIQVGLEGILKYIYVCKWFRQAPIAPHRYLLMWLPIIVSSLIAYFLNHSNEILALMISGLACGLISFLIEITDVNMRKRLHTTLNKIRLRK